MTRSRRLVIPNLAKAIPARRLAILVVLLASFTAGSRAETRFPRPAIPCAPRAYVCFHAADPIVLDGRLDDPGWQNAPWTEPFVDIEGPGRPSPPLKTRAKLLWDDAYLYVGAEMEEPHLWATYRDRDAVIYHENDFEVFLDPDGDTHEYYELEINALNTVWDLLLLRPYRDGGPAVHAWDIAGLRTEVALDGSINDSRDRDQGWTVEIAFPWKILAECAHRSVPPGDGDQWRVNFSRVEWRLETDGPEYRKTVDPATGRPYPESNWVWSPQGLIAMHYPEMWGVVQFSRAVSGPVTFRPDPDDAARWVLREVYYAQKERAENGRAFTAIPDELAGMAAQSARPDSLRMTCTETGFEATVPASGGGRLHIDQTGRAWKTAP